MFNFSVTVSPSLLAYGHLPERPHPGKAQGRSISRR
jgi:hypothetical protein